MMMNDRRIKKAWSPMKEQIWFVLNCDNIKTWETNTGHICWNCFQIPAHWWMMKKWNSWRGKCRSFNGNTSISSTSYSTRHFNELKYVYDYRDHQNRHNPQAKELQIWFHGFIKHVRLQFFSCLYWFPLFIFPIHLIRFCFRKTGCFHEAYENGTDQPDGMIFETSVHICHIIGWLLLEEPAADWLMT